MRVETNKPPRTGSLVAALCCLALAGCTDSPEAALLELKAAARQGKAELMYPRLTSRSIPLVAATVQVGGESGPLAFKKSDVPVELVSAHHQGENSVLVVKEADKRHVIPLILEGGRWKVDLFLMTGFMDGDRLPHFPRGATAP